MATVVTAAVLWGPIPLGLTPQKLYQSPAATITTVLRAPFTNVSNSAVTLTVWVVRSGGSTATGNILTGASAAGYNILSGPSIPYIPNEMANLNLGPGDSVWAQASIANALNSVGSGYVSQ